MILLMYYLPTTYADFTVLLSLHFQGILDIVVSSRNVSEITTRKQEFTDDACFIKVTGNNIETALSKSQVII